MTSEEEAKTKECRAVPYQFSDSLSMMNHDGSVEPMRVRAMCVASRCMMWRWHIAPMGYCGLAGKP